MNKLFIPGSNIEISDGTVVTLANYPGVKWIVHYGWYRYNGTQCYGWYFSSIPTQTTMPVTDDDLATCAVIVSPDGQCPPGPCPPYPPCPPGPGPHPCPPGPPVPPSRPVVDPAFITVQTLIDRDRINAFGKYVPDGKLVRVNNVDGQVKYYVWNAYNNVWDETTIVDAEMLIDTPPEEKLLDITGNVLSSHLTINTIVEEGTTYIALLGKDGAEISRLDASVFIGGGDTITNIQLVNEVIEGKNHPILRLNYVTNAGVAAHTDVDLISIVHIYEAAQDGGLQVDQYNKFSIINTVTPNAGGVNTDITIEPGVPTEVKTITYDAHGLITGERTFTVTVSGVSGAMHFLGETTTPVTNGGTEKPTISGQVIDVIAGDVVLYQGLEFVWDGAKWIQLGDESSYALKSVTITGASGLAGGGDLTGNRTITHIENVGSSGTVACTDADNKVEVISNISYDQYGHFTQAPSKTDITSNINALAGAVVATELGKLDYADVSGDYVTAVTETDGKIAVTKAAKGAIAQNNTQLVDGGTVYSAVADAIETATLRWTVV